MTQTLNLYKIKFETTNLQKIRTQLKFGFAFVLATNCELARQKWLIDTVDAYMWKGPSDRYHGPTLLRKKWTERWRSTLLIKGPFENGFIICNGACDLAENQ